ncbi:hypothetical protein [Algoriphagus sp.]|uniref:hypothetical protein n=1 Tax=Algoriphagus sp. TaxID=1872435 RepID=UPI0025EDD22E|nr:hypothetical protein [Algoriphagus sp.]
MGGLAQKFNEVLQKELNLHAAWFPITNTFQIGDFGLFDDGLFRTVGNIKRDYPEIELVIDKGTEASIDFKSDGTSMQSLNANGEAATLGSLGNADAKLLFKFTQENSMVLKAKMTSDELKNIDEVGRKLSLKDSWNKKYKVVSTVYNGEGSVIICSKEAGTEISISAAANVLKQVEGGKVDGALQIQSNKQSVFSSIGETGIIGLRFFKLKWLGQGVSVLAETQGEVEVEKDVINDDDF